MKINKERAIEFILKEMYSAEFQVIDGINQHYKGWSYQRWLEDKGLIEDTSHLYQK